MKYSFTYKILVLVGFVLYGNASDAQGPFNIGNIPAGDSVVIYYDVTINTGLPPTVMYIANQGLVSGSNFANVVTDDPETGTALDSTKTLFNVFVVPVTVSELKAIQKNNSIELAWKVTGEYNMHNYAVEKSADGNTFLNIGYVSAAGRTNYLFNDLNPLSGNNYYRLKINDRDGRFKYSNVVKVSVNNKGQSIAIFPNPVYDKVLNLQLNNLAKGKYELIIYSNSGQAILKSTIDHAGGSAGQTIALPDGIVKGVYSVKLVGGKVVFNQVVIVR